MQERQALFRPQPETLQRRREPARSLLQFGVSQRTVRVDEGDFLAEPARDRRIDEISGGVVRLSPQQVFQHRTTALPRGVAAATRADQVCMRA